MEVCDGVEQLRGDLSPLEGRRGLVALERAPWDVLKKKLWASVESCVLQGNDVILN